MLTVAMNAAKSAWIVLVVFIVSSDVWLQVFKFVSSFTCTCGVAEKHYRKNYRKICSGKKFLDQHYGCAA
jgi:hypothetical protein